MDINKFVDDLYEASKDPPLPICFLHGYHHGCELLSCAPTPNTIHTAKEQYKSLMSRMVWIKPATSDYSCGFYVKIPSLPGSLLALQEYLTLSHLIFSLFSKDCKPRDIEWIKHQKSSLSGISVHPYYFIDIPCYDKYHNIQMIIDLYQEESNRLRSRHISTLVGTHFTHEAKQLIYTALSKFMLDSANNKLIPSSTIRTFYARLHENCTITQNKLDNLIKSLSTGVWI